MSRITRLISRRTLPLAGTVLAAALIAPAAAEAQNVHFEGPLLNHVVVPSHFPNPPGANPAALRFSGTNAPDDGSRALLARSHGDLPEFYRAAEEIGRLPEKERAAALNRLSPSPAPVIR